MGPVVGVRYSLPEISPGSFILPQVIYLKAYAVASGAISILSVAG